ncbi:MAG TPA: PhnD/SsuA/transferrin family substrate-binding protein [Casimicrobiaceae bacterium]|nr:PhnD/SsuA/transferrin family substrate-binding protein [Casimicrobiaceae bacterium]
MFRSLFACLVLAAVAATASAQELVFAVTEGVTYQATPKEIRDKFAPIADVIAKATGRHVRVVLVPAYDDLRAGCAKQEFDLAFVHPAHVSLAEIKSGRYKPVAWTAGFTDYTVALLMEPSQPLKSIDDLKGRTLVTPDPDSITAAMVRAMLRVAKLPTIEAPPKAATTPQDPGTVRVIATRYQDAVPFYIENGFAQVGATAAKSVIKAWTDKGGKILVQSRPVPIKQFIASSKMPAEEQAKIREALIGMVQNKPGRDALEIVGYKGFVAPEAQVESASIAWLGL